MDPFAAIQNLNQTQEDRLFFLVWLQATAIQTAKEEAVHLLANKTRLTPTG